MMMVFITVTVDNIINQSLLMLKQNEQVEENKKEEKYSDDEDIHVQVHRCI